MIADAFYWMDGNWADDAGRSDAEKYQSVAEWAQRARGVNPDAFDAVTRWLTDDAQWTPDKLAENERAFARDVIGRFRAQNARLRSYLRALSQDVVTKSVYAALDRFDGALSGQVDDAAARAAAARMFGDFAQMLDPSLRAAIAGGRTGHFGTDSVSLFGYVNILKDLDAGVQWTLFMPDVVRKQQRDFRMTSFVLRKMPPMRFIGFEGEAYDDIQKRVERMQTLRDMKAYATELDFDALLIHHYGMGVDVGECHCVWGRFLRAGAPVPEGYMHFDFAADRASAGTQAGPPYLSQFAYSAFAGDMEAMHARAGYDSDAMYDVTRNTILAQGVNIPYPDKYWTAEAFLDGCDKPGTAYLFSVEL